MKRRVGAAFLAAGLSLMAGCSTSSQSESEAREGGGIEAEPFDDFMKLRDASDLVVVGRIETAERGPDEGELATVRVAVRPEGQDAEPVVVSIGIGPAADYDLLYTDLRRVLPKGRSIWFLRSIEEFYPGVYRLVNQSSLIGQSPAGFPDFPLLGSLAEDVRSGKVKPSAAERVDGGELVANVAMRRFDDMAKEASPVAE